MKVLFFIIPFLFSCSGGSGSDQDQKALDKQLGVVTEAQEIKQEVQALKEELNVSDHQLNLEELKDLSTEGFLSDEDTAELLALANQDEELESN